MTRLLLPLAALLLSALIGCSPAAVDRPCASGITTRLYLGQDTPAGTVTDAQWKRFVEDWVTPRFPDGFTVMQGEGTWRSTAGVLHREDTRVIEIIHDGSASAHLKAREVGAAYQQRFLQESVLIAQAPTVQCLYASGDWKQGVRSSQ